MVETASASGEDALQGRPRVVAGTHALAVGRSMPPQPQCGARERRHGLGPDVRRPARETVLASALDVFLPAETSGRVLLALCVLVFGAGFRFLMRSVQGRPTATELLGPPLAYGSFLYAGYLSYVFSLGVAFFGIGLVHRLESGK
jgi:hypothetical protein